MSFAGRETMPAARGDEREKRPVAPPIARVSRRSTITTAKEP